MGWILGILLIWFLVEWVKWDEEKRVEAVTKAQEAEKMRERLRKKGIDKSIVSRMGYHEALAKLKEIEEKENRENRIARSKALEREKQIKEEQMKREKKIKEEKERKLAEEKEILNLKNNRPSLKDIKDKYGWSYSGNVESKDAKDYLEAFISGFGAVIFACIIEEIDAKTIVNKMMGTEAEIDFAESEIMFERFHEESEYKVDVESIGGEYLKGNISDDILIPYYFNYYDVKIGTSKYFKKIDSNESEDYFETQNTNIGEILYNEFYVSPSDEDYILIKYIETKDLYNSEVMYSKNEISNFDDGKSIQLGSTFIKVGEEVLNYSGSRHEYFFGKGMYTSLWKSKRLKKLQISDLWSEEYINLFKVDINESSVQDEVDLKGRTFCITGKLSKPRNYYKDLLISKSANVTESVSNNTDYLVANDQITKTNKLAKAREIGIKIIDENELLRLIGD